MFLMGAINFIDETNVYLSIVQNWILRLSISWKSQFILSTFAVCYVYVISYALLIVVLMPLSLVVLVMLMVVI